MKVIYMECTLALLANISPMMVEELSSQGKLKHTETTRYLVIQETDGETGSNGEN
jgi:hypothetical protein